MLCELEGGLCGETRGNGSLSEALQFCVTAGRKADGRVHVNNEKSVFEHTCEEGEGSRKRRHKRRHARRCGLVLLGLGRTAPSQHSQQPCCPYLATKFDINVEHRRNGGARRV
jgi:hypothetical protein